MIYVLGIREKYPNKHFISFFVLKILGLRREMAHGV